MVRITGVHKCQPKMHSQVINGFSFTGAFCAFCAFSASYQLSATYDFFPQCFRRWFLGCCGWRAKHLSRSLWSFTRREVVELNMFGWRYSCYSCCLFDFVGYAIRCFAFPVGGTGKTPQVTVSRRVSTWALSVFFVQNSCWGSCRIKDLTMHDICYQILQGREVSCEKRGDFERWEVQELVGKWTTRLSAKTSDFGAVWATFSCYMLRYFFMR